jgi:hypothetical protein
MELVHQVYHKALPLWIYATESEAAIAAEWFAAKCKMPVSEMGIVSYPKDQMTAGEKISTLGM